MSDYTPELYAVILAGGSGTRFWPLSRELNPKQLLSIFGAESLLVQAIHRVLPHLASPPGALSIVTNERQVGSLQEHLMNHDECRPRQIRYLVEPLGRSTAPAIALAAVEIAADDPDAVMIVLPSDHVLDSGSAWTDTLHAAVRLAHDGYIVTIGVQPTHPETGYGYIEVGAPMPRYNNGTAAPHHINHFIEKPSPALAKALLDAGTYKWNAGICIMRATQVLDEMREHSHAGAEIVAACRWLATVPRDEWQNEDVRERFAALPTMTIDKALLERSPNVVVIPTELGWRDVGSLEALESLAAPDAAGNVRVGRGVDIDAHRNIVHTNDRLVALLGVDDLVVVDTLDATLICPKDRCQDVRLVVEALKAAGAEEILEPRTCLRPWGSWMTLLKGPGFQIKLLELKPGAFSGMHRHLQRSEHWVVLEGQARVVRDRELIDVNAHEGIVIAPGTTHRLENCSLKPLQIIEIQLGDTLGDDDIVRMSAELAEVF